MDMDVGKVIRMDVFFQHGAHRRIRLIGVHRLGKTGKIKGVIAHIRADIHIYRLARQVCRFQIVAQQEQHVFLMGAAIKHQPVDIIPHLPVIAQAEEIHIEPVRFQKLRAKALGQRAADAVRNGPLRP